METPAEKASNNGTLCGVEFVSECLTTTGTSTPTVITIKFFDLYLINELTFEGFYLVGPPLSSGTNIDHFTNNL